MRRVWPVVLVLAVAGLAGPARAQSSGGLLISVGAGKVVSETNVGARVTGQLVVSFHGDTATGCAAYGLCSYAGTIVVRPRGAALTIATLRHGKRTGHFVALLIGDGQTGNVTSARVQRSALGGQGGTCLDAAGATPFLTSALAVVHGGSVAVRLLARGGSMLQTRCAGPLDGDLASVSPAVTISLGRLMHGRTSLNFAGTRAFAVHGFAGTISSTLVVALGRPSVQPASSGADFPPGISMQRTRIVTERLHPVRVAGGLSVSVRGASDAVECGLLDSCGLSGTLTLTTTAREITGNVLAMGPADRPYRDFLTAIGLARGGQTRGITVAVSVNLTGDVRAIFSQAGATCTDTAATGGISAAVEVSAPSPGGGFGQSWRTRCPGPLLADKATGVAASLPAGALTHRRFAIRLRSNGSLTDDGYFGTAQGAISVLVRRGRVTSQVTTFPAR